MGLRWGRGADHERIGPFIPHAGFTRRAEGGASVAREDTAGAGQESVADISTDTGAHANPTADHLANSTAYLPNPGPNADANADPDPGANPNANRHTGTDADANRHTGPDADAHTGPDTDTHTGPDTDTHTGADTDAGARLHPLLRLDQFLEPADRKRARPRSQLGGDDSGGARRLRRERQLHQHHRLGPRARLLAQQ
jgi:hypothetical protein